MRDGGSGRHRKRTNAEVVGDGKLDDGEEQRRLVFFKVSQSACLSRELTLLYCPCTGRNNGQNV